MNKQQRRRFFKNLRILILLGCLIAVNLFAAQYIGRPMAVQTPPSWETQIAEESRLAFERYQKLTAKDAATVKRTAGSDVWQKAELLFSGLTDAVTMQTLLTALETNGQDATFYINSADISQYPVSLTLIHDAGFAIGARMGSMDQTLNAVTESEMVQKLAEAELSIKVATGIWPNTLLISETELPQNFSLCAAACGFLEICVPDAYFSATDGAPEAQSQTAIQALRRGSLLCVNLDESGTVMRDTFPMLAKALRGTDLNEHAAKICQLNKGAMAEVMARIYTSEKAVAFTFSGMRNEAELKATLDALHQFDGIGVFLISPDLPQRDPALVRELIDDGQALGVALIGTQYQTAQEAVRDVLRVQEALSETFGYNQPLVLRSTVAGASDLLREAASTLGLPLISSLLDPVRPADIRETDVNAVMLALFGNTNAAPLQRGEIVYFQMSQYQKSDTLLGELVTAIASQENPYRITSLHEMLLNPAVYTYPVPEADMLPSVRNVIHPGQLTTDVTQAIQQQYIGNPYYNFPGKMPGFTKAEIQALNKDGLVRNDQNCIFLTFDDWGTDQHITKLLDVLEKHNATATFFVRTNNIHYNPNLLRAIAVGGHTIGSHTNKHLPLSNNADANHAESLTSAQMLALQSDLVVSWQTLQSVIGDVTVNGKPALIPIFRPPTLAVSKEGIEAVLDCGFHYVISGSTTTQDYAATSADDIFRMLVHGTQSGAVFVMHMSDNSVYTADAVDKYLTYLETSSKVKYQVCGLNAVLQ